jgi:hypothetical protein
VSVRFLHAAQESARRRFQSAHRRLTRLSAGAAVAGILVAQCHRPSLLVGGYQETLAADQAGMLAYLLVG